MRSKYLIGVTGGIGSGKSVVCNICKAKGYPIYDCDLNAKRLMDSSSEIKNKLINNFGNKIIDDSGSINRKNLAQIIFADSDARLAVNAIVHKAVTDDIIQWISIQDKSILFVESAILHTSKLDKIVDEIWLVETEIETRIERVIKRNNISREDVEKRIIAQADEFSMLPSSKIFRIKNEETESLLIQIEKQITKIINKN